MQQTPPWLVVIDMQHAFGDPGSPWVTDGYDEAAENIEKLLPAFGDRVVYTRFVRDPAEPKQWAAYYDRWSHFRVPSTDPMWELTLDVASGAQVVDEPTFSKWAPSLQAIVGTDPLVLCGVATECCVLATAMGAADAGRRVQVVADGCAGATRQLHEQALTLMHANAPLISVVTSDQLQ